ncbi:MAG: hypothetical protein ACM3ML_26305 [Micromonosporaceae bacterium]
MRYLITAATPLPSLQAARFLYLYGLRLRLRLRLRKDYGLTEAVNFSVLMPFRRHYVDAPPPVGHALPGTRIRIRDSEVLLSGRRGDTITRGGELRYPAEPSSGPMV